MTLAIVIEDNNYARDENSCIVNINDRDYQLALNRSQQRLKEQELYSRVNQLEQQNSIIIKQLEIILQKIGDPK